MRDRVMVCAVLLCSSIAVSQCERRIDGPPNFRVRSLQIEGLESLSSSEASSLRKSVEQICFQNANELAERTRDLFQQRGYFKATVEGPRLIVKQDSRWPAPADVLLAVSPGEQYRLQGITFSGNKALNKNASLRELFPLRDGEILDISRVRAGIKRMKDVYAEYGFIDFAPIPDFKFDQRQKLAALHIDIDEGKAFTIEQVDIRAPAKLLSRFVDHWYLRVGDIYNSRAVSIFFEKNRKLLAPGMSSERNVKLREDREKGTLVIHVNVCGEGMECKVAYVPCRPDLVCENDAAGIPRFVRLRNKP